MNSFVVEMENGSRLELTLKTNVYDGVQQKKRPMMVIFPGGGYHFCSDREAEPIALAFLERGFDTCIVWYTVREVPELPGLGDLPLHQAAEAVRYVREHAEQWNVDADKISIIGFSAGGHLAASLAVHWNNPERIPFAGEMTRVNGAILSYPVITAGELTHRGSIENLTGVAEYSAEDAKYDVTAYVGKDTPPAFIWHTYEDTVVPVENSLQMALAMRKAGRPCALHIFTKGAHGLALAAEDTGGGPNGLCKWVDLACDWLKNMDLT